ncbi:MAG: hypothetical protein E7048_07655 [Lentisphaerae bacterium]|nr:hypothetical protein [Lentisphaerota bacterium]
MKIPYEQLTPEKALETYCDWIVERLKSFTPPFEWYYLFYPIRTLILGAKYLNREDYAEAVWPWLDEYCAEQFPSGALSSTCRGKAITEYTVDEIEDYIRTGKLNLADGGSNVHGLFQAALYCKDPERKKRYIDCGCKWLDNWVPIWSLPNGAYGNGIWLGHKVCEPYSMAMNVCSAFAGGAIATGDKRYVRNAERFAMFQCDNIHESGVPIRYNLYPVADHTSLIGDFSRIFYMMEAFCWVHYVSSDTEVRTRIADMMKKWIEADILPRWPEDFDWFDMNKTSLRVPHTGFTDSGLGIRFYWQACKCCGVPSLLQYYVDNMHDDPEIRKRCKQGAEFLSNPLKARMLAVMAEDVVPHFCLQATGFAGLTVAEGIRNGATFEVFGKMPGK